MIIKKIAVPFINEKLLVQAEHCLIATSGISESGFDFVVGRLSVKCKVEIVTGLDVLTSPKVLFRIWKHFTDRVKLKIFANNFFHPNVYIFDLPYRKSVAFIGSGNLTLGGLKDNEELFYKISDAKEIEALKSWFIGYYEFAEPLTESIIQEYELIYPDMKQREIESRQEKKDVLELTTRGFDWDYIKFKNKYFKKEDFLTLSNAKASFDTPEIRKERLELKNKMHQLHELIIRHVATLKLFANADSNQIVSSVDRSHHNNHKLRTMWIAYGRSKTTLRKYSEEAMLEDFTTLQVIIRQKEIGIWLVVGKPERAKEDREYFLDQMMQPEYRSLFLKSLKDLGAGYWIEIAGEKRSIELFLNEDSLYEFTRIDDWRINSFVIGTNYSPAAPEIDSENIAPTIEKEFDKLVVVYNLMMHKPPTKS